MKILLVILVMMTSSCKKKEDPVPPHNEGPHGALKKVWVRPLVESAPPGSLSISGFVFEDHVYFSNEYTAELKGYPLSGEGGVRSLAKGQFFMGPGRRNYELLGSDLYICLLSGKIQKLDMYTGQLIDIYQGTTKMGSRMSYYNGKIYFEEGYFEGSILLSLDVLTKEIDTIINQKLDPGWGGSFEPPTVFEQNGKTMLAFQLRQAAPGELGEQSYYLYDTDADSLLWSQIAIDSAEGGIGEPAIDDRHIYWMGNTTVFALDLETGEVVWKHHNPDKKGHWLGFIYKYQDKVIVKSDGMITTALNPETGKVLWMNYQTGSSPSDTYEILDDAICFYSMGKGYFSAVDLQSGKSLIYEMSPVKNYDNDITMGTSIVIDQSTRKLYYANYSHVVCLEIAPYGQEWP